MSVGAKKEVRAEAMQKATIRNNGDLDARLDAAVVRGVKTFAEKAQKLAPIALKKTKDA